jgi:hypothetical protein
MEQRETGLNDIRHLGDVELIAGLHRLARADQALTARLLVHLGEMDARGLYREHAFPSMFAYAVEELHMSEAEAYLRIHAARLGREFPLVLRMLAKGELHLTAIKLLGRHLTLDNHARVLERAKFKGKREIELLVAELAPKPDVPSVMRKLPEPSSARATVPTQFQLPSASATNDRSRVQLLQQPVSRSVVRYSGDRDRESFGQPSIAPVADGNRVPLARSSIAATTGDRKTGDVDRRPLPQPSFAATTGDRKTGDADREVLPQPPFAATGCDCNAYDGDREPLPQASFAATTREHNAHADREPFQLNSPRPRVSSTTPLRPGRYEVSFTAGQSMQVKLERLQNLLRYQVPGGDLGIILERAADLLLEKTMKERFAQNTRRVVRGRSSEPSGAIRSQPTASTTNAERTETAAPSGAAASRPTASSTDPKRTDTTSWNDAAGSQPPASTTNAERTERARPSSAADSRPIASTTDVERTETTTRRRAIASQPSASITDSTRTETTRRGAIASPPSTSITDSKRAGTTTRRAATSQPSASITDSKRTSEAKPGGAIDSQRAAATTESERAATTKLSAVTSRARPTQARSRYVPRAVVREVYERDGGRCTFVSPNGRQCTERGFLELHHHETPYARGGAATAANLRTVCRAHNMLFGERDFGRGFMQSKVADARLRKRKRNNGQVPERLQE